MNGHGNRDKMIFMKKRWITAGLILLFLIAFLASPLAPYVESLAVMKVYSGMNEKESLFKEKGINIDMESGEGWYPFVMTFNADAGFRSFTGDKNIRLTILYNFPEFDLSKGCSKIYDSSSDYYNSFYGAYVINGNYVFDEEGKLDMQKASQVPEYDFTRLVLSDLGMSKEREVFAWSPISVVEGVEFIGYDNWVCIDADMTVNGMLHIRGKYLRNYIQYGAPNYDTEYEFMPVDMKGRIYAKYFEEKDCSIFFYIMTGDEEILKECDENILSQSRINF